MAEELEIVHWPDPHLKRLSAAVNDFGPHLRELADVMLVLMRGARGVGLAAPQIARNIRLFVMNPTGEPGDDRIFVNPVLLEADGQEEAEEGCLSLPNINVKVFRSKKILIGGHDINGNPFNQELTDFPARVWQHEFDHLNGTLIIDRMGPVARMANRKTLKELEEEYERKHPKKKKRPPL